MRNIDIPSPTLSYGRKITMKKNLTFYRLQNAALALSLLAIISISTSLATAAPPSSLTVGLESRVNKPNAMLPLWSDQNPATPIPRFPQTKQNEPSIAVNPLNPLNLIAGANDEQFEPPCQDLNGDGSLSGLAECPFAPNVGSSGVYVSTDGGATWTDLGILDNVTSAAFAGWTALGLYSSGDPAVAFDASGNAYYANLALPLTPAAPQYEQAGLFADLVVAKAAYDSGTGTTGLGSSDWVPYLVTKSVPVRFDDKENIWVDTSPTSPFMGTVYVSWSTFTANQNSPGGGIASDHIAIARSTDGGVTWSKPVTLSRSCNIGCGGVQGSVVRTGPDGAVYVAWEESLNRFSPNAIVIAKSTDGGRHFNGPMTVVSTIVDVPSPLNGPSFRDLTPKAGFRDNSFPTMTVDPNGIVYVAWGDNRYASSGSRTEVLFAKSTDGGNTWTSPAIVSKRSNSAGDPGDQFFPWITSAKDPVSGTIGVSVVYYDRSYDGVGLASCSASCTLDNTRLFSVTVAVSVDGGSSWAWTKADTTANGFDAAGSSTNGQGAQFMGDYIYAASVGAKVFVVWTDARNGFAGAGKAYTDSGSYGDSDIFFASLTWTP